MSRTYVVDPERPDDATEALDAAAAALEAGELVVFPTETVYGIACRPHLPEATDRLFAAKQRPGTLNLPILAASVEEAWLVGRRSDQAASLADRFWPGALTLVLERTEHALAWALGERRNSVGVRVPDHPIAAALLRRTGPLAVTSANLSGQPPLSERASIEGTFAAAASVILVLPPGAPPPEGASSTVVDLTQALGKGGLAQPLVLREGPIDRNELAGVLGFVVIPQPSAPKSAPGSTR